MTAPVPSLAEASRAIAAGTLSPVALTEQALARIEALEPKLHAFITVTADRARAAARQAEAEIRAGQRRGPLHGIPYALKDIYDVAGVRTTAHSRVLIDNVAASDSNATERLEAAGMVLLGKLSTHEFARGGPTDQLPFPNACNPWDVTRFAGGSSSGSGAAVSSGMVGLAMGSDTGGSIRIPAACTGIVGLKPTYGRVSRAGVVPLSFSMDHTGPLTRTIEDCALSMQVLAGYDPRDPGSGKVAVPDYSAGLKSGIAGMRIGYARGYDAECELSGEQQAAMDAAVGQLRALGAEVVDVVLPSRTRFNACLWTIILAEGFSIHQKELRERPQDYGRVTRERLLVGTFVTGPHYVQAQRLRRVLIEEVDAVLAGCDAILSAGFQGAAIKVSEIDEGPWRRSHPNSGAFNATGHPALVLPVGFSGDGMPLSMSLAGKAWDEATLLRIGYAYEQATGWFKRRPEV